MNPQEIYDTVAKHLFAQGMRSRGKKPNDAASSCMYRGPNGTKCAVGILISDKLYEPTMEGSSITGLFANYNLPDWMNQNLRLLIALQDTHDYSWYWYGSDRMKERLAHVAGEFSLSAAVLDVLKFEWEVEVEAK